MTAQRGLTFSAAWSAAVDIPGARETGDPIGLRAWANQVAERLVPGLTNSTHRVHGYGLLAAGLQVGSQSPVAAIGAVEVWLRLERMWVMAQWGHHRAQGWPGTTVAKRLALRNPVDITVPLLGQQLSAGTWGAYRRSAGLMGLITPRKTWTGDTSARATSPVDSRLTGRGIRLASAWMAENVDALQPASRLAKVIKEGEVTDITDLLGVLVKDEGARPTTADSLTRAIESSSLVSGLAGLRKVWDLDQDLSPKALVSRARLLDSSQEGLPEQAVAVHEVWETVEQPYRRYLVSGDEPAPDPAVWDLPCWHVAAAYSADMARLRDLGRGTPRDWSGVEAWAKQLAGRRATTATEVGMAPRNYGKAAPPAMALRSAAALFSQGLLGPALDDAAIEAEFAKANEVAGSEGA